MIPKRVQDGSEVEMLKAFLSSEESTALFTNLCRIEAWKTLLAIVAEWALIVLAMILLFQAGLVALPITLFCIGTRQRALSTLLHEAGHCLISENRRFNDIIGNFFLAFPLGDSVRRFRSVHVRHHFYLGDMKSDADYHHSETFIGHAGSEMLRLFFSPTQWLSRGWIGALSSLTGRELLSVVCWWLFCFTFVSIFTGLNVFIVFIMIWLVARVTVFYGLGILLDFTDHVGLRPGSIAGFTRTCSSYWGLFWLHPYWNGFHLAHHLIPGIPWYNLPKAHRLLLRVPSYASAHHCDGYFFGAHTALQCINRNCISIGDN
jgi:fatty acid desaturase